MCMAPYPKYLIADPTTTVVPFSALPSCAVSCGPLYDANGACVPPAAATANAVVYDQCFCSYSALQAFSSTTAGVCDAACTGEADGLSSIQSWFTSFCASAATATDSSSTSTSTSSSKGSSNSGGGDWMSNHWKWVIMIVIVVVGIGGIWIGACIWRRKYLKKKDRMYELGKGLPSTVAVNAQGKLVGPGARTSDQPGLFMSGPGTEAGAEKPKKERKRWNVKERT
ncbi:hypothetical protein PFICI_00841 [Pestalotiopsis fici W106-1]|uniref:Integral membrane protein n=1 Tax=Pestalotiopsis fici (strain W106-1 / CGMCC3.15140) TaxID=1229662 RepID=W3XLS5_PESFW|nr:uncharacterized protein PFICI_00841 [Pestalotiopsis fici W106-1]ETS87013.1 hypothetical protein PFICI_00841 [Pestalotiopsis fici W106-1]